MDEAGRLLEVYGAEAQPGLGAEGKMLLAAGDERLVEPAAERLAAEQAQAAGHFGQREEALGIGRAQPLEVSRQACGGSKV